MAANLKIIQKSPCTKGAFFVSALKERDQPGWRGLGRDGGKMELNGRIGHELLVSARHTFTRITRSRVAMRPRFNSLLAEKRIAVKVY